MWLKKKKLVKDFFVTYYFFFNLNNMMPCHDPFIHHYTHLVESNSLLHHNNTWCMNELSVRVNEVTSLRGVILNLDAELLKLRENCERTREELLHEKERAWEETAREKTRAREEVARAREEEKVRAREQVARAKVNARVEVSRVKIETTSMKEMNVKLRDVLRKEKMNSDDMNSKLVRALRDVKTLQAINAKTGVLLALALKERDDALLPQ